MAEVSSFFILWFNSRRSNDPSGFGNCVFRHFLLHDYSLWPKMKLSVRLDAAALQFGFYRVKEDLGWHHCKIGPEDDRGARGD
jgi:hypothetical protein